MQEYLDIVDENNGAPIEERRLRSEVHSQGLWHRVVHVYLFRRIENDIAEVGLPPADSKLSPELFVFAKKKGVAQCFCCRKPDLATLVFPS